MGSQLVKAEDVGKMNKTAGKMVTDLVDQLMNMAVVLGAQGDNWRASSHRTLEPWESVNETLNTSY